MVTHTTIEISPLITKKKKSMKNFKIVSGIFFYSLRNPFKSFYFFLVIVLASCGETSSDNDTRKTDSTANLQKQVAAPAAFRNIQSHIDTLFLEEKDFRDYYYAIPHGNFRKNKAVLQFAWPILDGNQYFTLSIYPSINHRYPVNEILPLLYLKNANTGSNVSISDTVILGDQQLSGSGSNSTLSKIRVLLQGNTGNSVNDQLVIFSPAYDSTSKHLYYNIYVIAKSTDGFNKDFIFPTNSFVGRSDPSPPADPLR